MRSDQPALAGPDPNCGRVWLSVAVVVLLAAAGFASTAGAQEPQPLSGAAPGEPADATARGELDDLGLLLMGRHAEMPEIKPPEFFKGPPEPDKPSGPPYKTGPKEGSPVVVPPPALGPGDGTIFAEGDSVMVGQENVLPRTTAGWDLRIDARVGRTFPEGIASMRTNQASIGQVVVVILGHNYGGGSKAAGYIDQIMALSAKAQRVVLVTEVEWSPAQPEVNREMYEAAKRYSQVVVAPWAETVKANPEFLADHVHPNAAGRVALANLIAVMVGPVSASDGNPKPPRPQILPIPPTPSTTTSTRLAMPTTQTTASPGSSSTSTSVGTTAPTTTTSAPPSTDSSTTTASALSSGP